MIKEYTTENIRNVCVIGHGAVGKTTVVENLLYFSGAIKKIGSVENGDSISDFEEEEIAHKISVHNALVATEFNNTKINIIDTPGIPDFVGEVRAALRVCEGAIVVVDSIEGIQMGTKKIWDYANEYKVPRIIFVNKMDKEEANFDKLMDKLKRQLKSPIVPIELPVGEGDNFKGIIDLVLMKALYPKSDKSSVETKDIPDEYKEIAEKYRNNLEETIADIDDKLIDKVLNGIPLSNEEIAKGILELTQNFKITPIVVGSTKNAIGIVTLLKMIINFLPAPPFAGETIGYNPDNEDELIERKPLVKEPITAFIYKTRIDQYSGKFSYFRMRAGELRQDSEVLNVNNDKKEKILHIYSIMGKKQIEVPKIIAGDIGAIAKLENVSTGDTLSDPQDTIKLPPLKLPKPIHFLAVKSGSKADTEKMMAAFNKMALEDPTFKVGYNSETEESVISGMGEIQIKIIMEKVEQKNNIKITTSPPKVAYRETIAKKAIANYKHKKQTGGHGQYGEVYLRIEPIPIEKHLEFKDEIVGGAIPKNFIPGVEKGVIEAMEEGVLAKYPATGIKVTLYDGSFHPVDSSELSFKIAGIHATKAAIQNAKPIILEPIMNIEIQISEDFVGTIIGDLQGRRGKVMGLENNESTGNQLIKAQIPNSELQSYSIELRSLTQDQASFEVEFSHYEPLIAKLSQQLIKERSTQV